MPSILVSPAAPLRTAPPIVAPLAEAEQIARLVERAATLGAPRGEIRVARAPLRICPLGAHIDHQLGIVTGMTIDQSILMAFAPADDDEVRIESLNFASQTAFRVGDVPAHTKGDWGNYVRGAVLGLRQEHEIRRGMVGVVGGDMPIGGLSSSAAVTIAYLLALEAINGVSVRPEENVALCRFTENQYIGLNNGILDQSVILYSEPEHLTRIDCATVEVTRVPAAPAATRQPLEILVVYSGVSRTLVGTDYNNRVAECREAASQLLSFAGMAAPEDVRLRAVPPEVFAAEGQRLAEPLRRRATHYFGEMDRVAQGVEAWRVGDMARFGRLVTASGESSIKWYECGSPQLITLYEILAAARGVYGTRFSGAGFRGNCIALIDPAARAEIAEAIHRRYPVAHPEVADDYSIHFCTADGGARLLAPREVGG